MLRKVLFIGVFLFMALPCVIAQENMHTKGAGVADKMNWNNLPNHPRLFANEDRITSIKLQKDKISEQLFFILKKDAEKRMTADKIIYPNQVSNMGTSRNVQGRIISLALAYRLFGDKRFLDKAKDELLELAELKDWGVGHFLDVGEASLAAGIGFDWLYNDLSDAERKTVAEAIKNKALIASLEVKENNGSWVNGNFNWNPVCHAGLSVGALAIAELEPSLAKQIVDRGIKNIPIAGDAYSPDGAFAEGPSYWSYGTSFYVLEIEALRSVFGNSASLEKIPGFLKTADYNNQMVAPTGEEYNYSDYHSENLNEPIMLWFARELNRPDLIKDELNGINSLYEIWLRTDKINQGKKIVQSRHMPFELLWWHPEMVSAAMGSGATNHKKNYSPPLHWTADGLMPIGVIRSSWNDPKATFIAIKGGTPDNSHGHMDAGSFIMEADGIRWAVDLGTESYDKMRAAKLDLWNYSQNSSRWSTFRVGPEGHNILRFDNELQLINGIGEVKELKMNKGVMGNEANLSSLYANKASKVIRKVLLNPDRSVSIQDEWTAAGNATEVSFQWLTKAKVSKTSYGLLLQQDGQSLKLKIEQPVALNDLVIEIEDVSAARNLQDSPNPGLSRIIIKMKTAANSSGKLFIRAFPGSLTLNPKAGK